MSDPNPPASEDATGPGRVALVQLAPAEPRS
jgi:hypothetical protein